MDGCSKLKSMDLKCRHCHHRCDGTMSPWFEIFILSLVRLLQQTRVFYVLSDATEQDEASLMHGHDVSGSLSLSLRQKMTPEHRPKTSGASLLSRPFAYALLC